MKTEFNNFIIEYDKNIEYMPDIIQTLENNTQEILDFFDLKQLSKKKRIIIYTDREEYKKHMLKYVKEFKEWMCGDTYGGDINLLEIEEAKKSKEHKNMDIEEFTLCILHEFVHACQQELNNNSNGTGWYWEALATNLSGQSYKAINLEDCNFERLKNDFNNLPSAYNYAYTIGKFMLENYSKDKLLDFIKNPDLLKENADEIFTQAKEYQQRRTK